jgi:hypothetical protein
MLMRLRGKKITRFELLYLEKKLVNNLANIGQTLKIELMALVPAHKFCGSL